MNIEILPIFFESIHITLLVMIMMMLIEYVNIRTKGSWSNFLQKHKSFQLLFATLMGLTPGCIGSFAIVSMYTHRMVSLGAIVAAFIASFGDEAFFMFSLIPVTTIWMSLILIVIALVAGYIVDIIFKNRLTSVKNAETFKIHHDKECVHAHLKNEIEKKRLPWRRILIFTVIIGYTTAMLTGITGHSDGPDFIKPKQNSIQQVDESSQLQELHEHDLPLSSEENSNEEHHHDSDSHGMFGFENIMFLLCAFLLLVILLRVNEHFVIEHLWNHVIKVHFVKVFLWTFSALLIIGFMFTLFDLQTWIESNQYALLYILIIALLIGIIPESGPHYVIILLFMNGLVPFSVLLANSIVQDGHGALPLLAESKKDFFLIKGINFTVGLIVGLLGFFTGW